ncbi:IgA receptor-like [Gymnodraco acuticeps]|uniref:IgA receptor-like n=1 Tax=Gymnodraco acuticeps TaxID=8218 RepID=A0A6P8SYV3_GYMAC|nr:IgA receptor-like [Gymnodraco acuticeps]
MTSSHDITDGLQVEIARALKCRHSSVLQFRAVSGTRIQSEQTNFTVFPTKHVLRTHVDFYSYAQHKSTDSAMDRTQSDQSSKETSHSQNDESLLQFDAETVKLLVMRGDELFECLTVCEERYGALEERYGALEEEMEAKEARHKQQLDENLVTINLLKRREEELLQSQEKSTKDLAEKQQSWENGKQGMKYVVDEKNYQAARNHTLETEKRKMEWKVKGVMKHNSQQTFRIHTLEKEVQKLVLQLEKQGEKNSEDQQPMEAKLKQVEKENEDLAKKNTSWETDVKQLKDQMREKEEKFSKDLAEEQLSWESEKHQLEGERREMETTLKQVEESKKKLAEENRSLELDVTLNVLLVKQFEKDMEVQQEEFSKRHQSWETKASSMETEIKEVTQEKEDLAQTLQSQATEFKDIQAQLHQAEDENNGSWETRVHQLEKEMKEQKEKCSKDLSQKHQSWETTVHLMETQLKEAKEERDNLAQTRLSWETKEKKMGEEKTLLEDLCLHRKNKSRGFFARRRATEERDVVLQKMLHKMEERR